MTGGEDVNLRARPSYRDALAQPEFAALFAARVLSTWGDHLARVAIATLVLSRSGSALLSAATFAVSFLPEVIGQALLAPYADRLPRRTLLVLCDLLRAAVVVLLLLAITHHLPLVVVLVLLFLTELVGSPFSAASAALVSDLFDDRGAYLSASSLLSATGQLNQVVGLALGGLVVGLVGPGDALWFDAATFVVSAVLLRLFVVRRRAAHDVGAPSLGDLLTDTRDGVSHLRQDEPMRWLIVLAWLMLLALVAPEAVALPYARAHGQSPAVGGLLLASVPLGAALGVLVVNRWSPREQVRRLLPLATLAPVPLLALAFDPPWQVAAVLFALSGACQGYMVPLMSTFTLLAPDAMRGRLNGLAGSGFALVSILALLLVGAAADATSPALAVVLSAGVTLLMLAAIWPRWPRRAIEQGADRAFG
ncbi:MAG: MFS transporter [Actinomycetota bacterium]